MMNQQYTVARMPHSCLRCQEIQMPEIHTVIDELKLQVNPVNKVIVVSQGHSLINQTNVKKN